MQLFTNSKYFAANSALTHENPNLIKKSLSLLLYGLPWLFSCKESTC